MYDPVYWVYRPMMATVTTLESFDGTNGDFPAGSLILDAAGDLFGTTQLGGSSNDGTVFELTPNGNGGYTTGTLVSFSGTLTTYRQSDRRRLVRPVRNHIIRRLLRLRHGVRAFTERQLRHHHAIKLQRH